MAIIAPATTAQLYFLTHYWQARRRIVIATGHAGLRYLGCVLYATWCVVPPLLPSFIWKYLFHLCVLNATGLKVSALQTVSFCLSEPFERRILFSYILKKQTKQICIWSTASFVLCLPFSAEWSKETTDWSWQDSGKSHFHFGAINRINRDPADNAKKTKKKLLLPAVTRVEGVWANVKRKRRK